MHTAKQRARVRHRRISVAEQYLQGHRQMEIAEALGVNQSTISRDLNVIQEEWQASAIRDFDAARAQELARIDGLERTYWEAWHRSVGVAKTETVKGTSTSESRERIVRTEELSGDPRYLSGVMDCIKKRCELLGIDAAKRLEHSGRSGGPIPLRWDDE